MYNFDSGLWSWFEKQWIVSSEGAAGAVEEGEGRSAAGGWYIQAVDCQHGGKDSENTTAEWLRLYWHVNKHCCTISVT